MILKTFKIGKKQKLMVVIENNNDKEVYAKKMMAVSLIECVPAYLFALFINTN